LITVRFGFFRFAFSSRFFRASHFRELADFHLIFSSFFRQNIDEFDLSIVVIPPFREICPLLDEKNAKGGELASLLGTFSNL
jgi:hypothetical protein